MQLKEKLNYLLVSLFNFHVDYLVFSLSTCFDGTGSGTTLRLKQMGMEFTVWVFKHVKIYSSILQPAVMFVLCKSRQYERKYLFILFVKK